jgi:hypothetical protein
MIWLSEILIQEHQLFSFDDLQVALKKRAQAGEVLFGIDIKPQFGDTPVNWESVLETIFTEKL